MQARYSGHTLVVLRRTLFLVPVCAGAGLLAFSPHLAFSAPLSNSTSGAPSSAQSPLGAKDTIGVNREPLYAATLENFHACVQNGDLAQVRRMAALNPALIKVRSAYGSTALHLAVLAPTPDVAAFLIEHGTDVNALDNAGQTPLHHAVTYPGKTALLMVTLLVSHGADVNRLDSFNNTPLRLAVATYDRPSATYLVAHGGHDTTTPLFDALAQGDEDRVRTLLQKRPTLANDSSGNLSRDVPRLVLTQELTPLHAAVLWNHPAIVQLLLDAKSSLSSRDANGQMPLHIAAQLNEPDVAEILLDAGAEVNAGVEKRFVFSNGRGYETGQTPLHLAASAGSRDVAELLLARGAKVDALTMLVGGLPRRPQTPGKTPSKVVPTGSTPLLYAVHANQTSLVALLLAHGAKANGADGKGAPILAALANFAPYVPSATKAAIVATVRLLLKAGANPNVRGVQTSLTQDVPLARAVTANSLEAVTALLDAGANVNALTGSSATPLRLSLIRSDNPQSDSITSLLVARGARINEQDRGGRTPLFDAVAHSNVAMVRLLLEHGADVSVRDKKNKTPLDVAFGGGDDAVLALLRGRGASNPMVLFFEAITKGDERAVASLLQKSPALLAARSPKSQTALTTALREGQSGVAKLLLNKGADVESRSWGEPELFAAVDSSDLAIIALVLEHGAKINERNDERYPVLFRAIASHNSEKPRPGMEIIHLLLRAGADAKETNNFGQTPLHICMADGQSDQTDPLVMDALLRTGAAVDARDRDGQTPLHLAATNGTLAGVTWLLAHGADVNARDKSGNTPLALAVKNGRTQVADMLKKQGGAL